MLVDTQGHGHLPRQGALEHHKAPDIKPAKSAAAWEGAALKTIGHAPQSHSQGAPGRPECGPHR